MRAPSRKPRKRWGLAVAALAALIGGGGLIGREIGQATLGPAGGAPRTTLVRGGRVYDPETGSLADADLVVRSGAITAIGSGFDPETVDAVLDVDGRYLLPGLVDAHANVLLPERCAEGALAAVTAIPIALAQRLAQGTTTVADLGAPAAIALGLRDALASEPSLTPRLLAGGPALSPIGQAALAAVERPGSAAVVEIDGADPARAWVKLLAKRRVDGIEVDVDLDRPELSGAARIDPAVLAATAAEAHRRDVRLYARARTVAGYEAALAVGADVIVHAATEPLPDDLVRRIATADVAVVPMLGAETSGDAARAVARDNVARLWAAGVTIAMGTEASPCTSVSPAAELAELQHAGLPVDAALRAATVGSARALGRQDVGRLAVGGPADVLVLRADPRVDPSTLADPWMVLLAGQVAPRDPSPPGWARTARWWLSTSYWSMRERWFSAAR